MELLYQHCEEYFSALLNTWFTVFPSSFYKSDPFMNKPKPTYQTEYKVSKVQPRPYVTMQVRVYVLQGFNP